MRKFFKKLSATLLVGSLLASSLNVPAKQPVLAAENTTTYEFEDGVMTGKTAAKTDEDGVGYVYLQDSSTNDSVSVDVTVDESGIYDLSISYMLPKAMGDAKTQYVLINDKTAGTVNFTATDEWRTINIGSYALKEGKNTITVKAFWGWMFLDSLTVEKASLPALVGNTELSDKQATASTQGLMNYLASIYGNHVLTGQQENCDTDRETEFNYIMEKTGKSPAIRAFDFLNTNPLFNWDDGTTDRMIEWANEKGGIVTASYHWFAPADMSTYELGERVEWANSSFYVNGAGNVNTNFDVSKISDETSVEYQYIMLSLEYLAGQLQKLEDADVPVIFRPLHEAGGSGTSDYSGEWFWWAAKGPEAYKYLWKLMYTTLTEKYDLHNLIWEFNSYTYENSYEWYPGDEYVDLIAFDKYNADENGPNESALSSTYYGLVKMYEGKKMVSMAECDTIPSVENLTDESTYWLYACPWYGEHITSSAKNSPETLNTIYNSELFLTLDELPDYKTYQFSPSTTEQASTKEKDTTEQTTTEKDTTEQATTSEENMTGQVTTSDENTTEQTTASEENTTEQDTTSEKNTTEQTTTSEKDTTEQTTTSEKNTTEQTTTSEKDTTEQTGTTETPTDPLLPITKYEFEDGVMTGNTTAQTDKDGVGYAYLQDASTNDSVSVDVTVDEAGIYDLSISYMLPKAMGDAKTQYVLINDKTAGTVNFTATDEWRTINIGSYALKEGKNTITVKAFWGWMFLDSLTVEKASLPALVGNTELSDKQATASTQGLMNYLASIYGNHVLTGQQENCDTDRETEFNYIMEKTGKSPAIRAFDFLNTNPLFNWDDGTTDRMIEWANEKGGIVTASYHWFAPADMSTYELGERVEWANSSFYVNGAGNVNTNFDVSKISDETSVEYQYIMLSLEYLAGQLQKLEDADVPVIFRPLHEAGGSGTSDYSGEWFWWAAKGPEAYKYLWKLMYTTLTEKYDLHNLIWEFNSYTYENSYEWYPGDEYVDLIAFDKYNADENGPNESALSSTYYGLVKMYEGKKMVSMAECDTIPSVENLTDESTYWLYACPWYGEHITSSAKNSPETLNTIYNSDLFLTLDELPDYKTFNTSDDTHSHNYKETTTKEATCTDAGEITYTCECGDTYTETIDALGHDYKEEIVAPTKTEQGYTNHTCTVCGDSYQDNFTDYIEEHQHTYKNEVTKLATCTTDGIITFTCECGDSYTEVIKATGHTYKDTVVEPTATEKGYTKHVCSVCEDTYIDNYVPALGEHDHNYTSKIIKAATCTTDGEKSFTCECGDTYTEVIKATGHTYKDTVVEPTTTSQGYTEHVCSACGDTYKDNYTPAIQEHSHSYSSMITNLPTCTTDGLITYTCSCGDSYTEPIKSSGHKYKDTIIAPTATEKGYTKHVCSVCEDTYIDNYTPATGEDDHEHTYTSKITKEATCTTDGEKSFTCECGDSYTETIKATGHTYKDTIVEATTSSMGYTEHTCTSCGDTYKNNYTPQIIVHKHSYSSKITKLPDCVNNGIVTYTCSCGDSYTDVINTTGHNYKEELVAPTKTSQGYTNHTCTVCGDSYQDNFTDYIEDHQHTYTSKITKEATCTTDGEKTFTCECGNSYTETIKATGHQYEDTIVKPTTSSEGYTLHFCPLCGDLFKDNYTAKLEETHITHTYTCTSSTKATCDTDGVQTYTCSCGDTYTNTIKATGHDLKTTTIKATTSSEGTITTICTNCKKETSSKVIPQIDEVTLSATTYTYNGKTKTPSVKVTDVDGNTLTKGKDYTVTYPSSRKNVGKYTVTVTFCGNYEGTVQSTFTILPKGTTIRTVKGQSKSIKLVLNTQTKQTNGYQILYSTSKKFTNGKTITIKKNSTKNITLKKLSSKKKYYVKVRTYKTVTFDGESVKLYSKWSSVKSVKTK